MQTPPIFTTSFVSFSISNFIFFAEWIKQKTKKSQEILIKEAKKQGRTLRKEEQSKDKTARSKRQDIFLSCTLVLRTFLWYINCVFRTASFLASVFWFFQ
jgi:uncharacterized ion transporter superfamily protein YfcC